MERSMPNIFTSDEATEMVLTSLPSWGDPILPDGWSVSEDESNVKLPLPEAILASLEQESSPTPFCSMGSSFHNDDDLVSLWEEEEEREQPENFFSEPKGLTFEDGDSSMCSLSDLSVPQYPRKPFPSSASTCSISSDEWSAMEVENDEIQEVETNDFQVRDTVHWIVEGRHNPEQMLCFKLKKPSGAYMELHQHEILDSISALMEDAIGCITFRILYPDGSSNIVDSTTVVATVQQLLAAEGLRERNAITSGHCDRRDYYQLGFCKSDFQTSHFRLEETGDYMMEEVASSYRTRSSSTWKTISGMSSTQPRLSARIE